MKIKINIWINTESNKLGYEAKDNHLNQAKDNHLNEAIDNRSNT